MKRLTRVLVLCIVTPLLAVLAAKVHGQSGVVAEAFNKANLRAGPGTDYPLVGSIEAGTKYPVIGRSTRFPWYLISLPDGSSGWVYKDLVVITGDINTVPLSDLIIATATPLDVVPPSPTAGEALNATTTPAETSLTPALTEPVASAIAPTQASAVYAEALERSNVRYGPGTDFPRVGIIQKGQLYAVLRRHATFDKWIEIAFAEVAGGRGWVFVDTVKISGNLLSVQAISTTNLGYPTLTPTAQMVIMNSPATPGAAVTVNLEALGNQIYDYLLAQNFEPGTLKQGSVFLLDLQSGQSVALNPNVAYSGASVMKLAVLVSFYRKISGAPATEQVQLLTEMINCSENLSSNRVLNLLGDGDEYRGTMYVTETLNMLGLRNSFLIRSFFTGARVFDGPTPTEQPFIPITTDADQQSAEPDPSNQMTTAEIGTLLANVYQCALDGGGPLPSTFPNDVDVHDCRRMVRLLRSNKINAMIEAGVPQGVIVAHKHGWVDETYGDAGIVFTPGGDYVLSITLHNREWLLQSDSFPVFAEVSRLAYNAYNALQPLAQTSAQRVPDVCTFESVTAQDPQLVADLQAPTLPPIK